MSPAVGLCLDCRHSRVISNRRGSEFRLCELSRSDRRFSRYPPLPVLRCPGFSREGPERTGPNADVLFRERDNPMSEES